MRVMLIEEAEPFVEATLIGRARCVRFAEAPFADEASLVTGGLEEFGHGGFIGGQGHQRIAANADVSRVAAGHERGSARGAHGAARVTLGESRPFGGEAVQVRGLDALLAVAAEFPATEIIGKDENDVWLTVKRGELFLEDVELRFGASGQCGGKQEKYRDGRPEGSPDSGRENKAVHGALGSISSRGSVFFRGSGFISSIGFIHYTGSPAESSLA